MNYYRILSVGIVVGTLIWLGASVWVWRVFS